MEKLKIRENDVLWNLYLKSQLGEKPKTLCQYFSGAMLGAFLHYYILNRFARLALAALLLTCVVNMHEAQGATWLSTLSLMIMIPSVIIALVGEWCEWGLSFDISERWLDFFGKCVLVTFSGAAIAMVSGILFCGFSAGTITVWNLLHDLCLIVGLGVNIALVIAALVAGYIYITHKFDFSPVKRLGSQIWQYLLAIKNRACPLVDAPEIKKIK